ncbi:ATP-grasp domain-containing protein [Actinomadura oligospora]|uniref:ATP-grasp domain-containing protein n=1 Tax=Actinomadura oligospora TaxID=111804 RepID=UPI0004B76155|nr:ATP-grasp domain-containing protein [Actinomadura oligospora]
MTLHPDQPPSTDASSSGALPRGALVVLGAAEEQIPLYREARRRGVPTIAVDMRADRPAIPFADAFVQVSTRDADAIAAALGDARPAGIVTCASDAGLAAWHALCLRFGTAYVYPEGALAGSTDKAAFHEVAQSVGVAGYGFVESDDPDEVVAEAARLRFPLVVKPADGSGSKGVVRVTGPDDLDAAVAHARAFAASGAVIAEEVVEGRQLVIETFMRDGRPHFSAVLEKEFVPGTDFMVGRLRCPARLPSATLARLEATAARLCEALGIADGPANFDVVLGPDGRERVIEVNARLGGNGIPRLLAAAYGVDNVRALVALALGEPFDLVPARAGHATLELIGSPLGTDGELVEVGGLDEARAVPGVTDLELFVRPGDRVRPFDQSGHKIGHLVAAGPSAEAADAALEKARAALQPIVRPLPTPVAGAVSGSRVVSAQRPAPVSQPGEQHVVS